MCGAHEGALGERCAAGAWGTLQAPVAASLGGGVSPGSQGIQVVLQHFRRPLQPHLHLGHRRAVVLPCVGLHSSSSL
jgi:hypothetical protein